MKNMNLKKIISSFLSLLLVFQLVAPTSIVHGINDYVDATFEEIILDDQKIIKIEGIKLNDDVQITSIKLPDNSIVESTTAEYKVTENGTYHFEVFYEVINSGLVEEGTSTNEDVNNEPTNGNNVVEDKN